MVRRNPAKIWLLALDPWPSLNLSLRGGRSSTKQLGDFQYSDKVVFTNNCHTGESRYPETIESENQDPGSVIPVLIRDDGVTEREDWSYIVS